LRLLRIDHTIWDSVVAIPDKSMNDTEKSNQVFAISEAIRGSATFFL
jgi:hypothetical protein